MAVRAYALIETDPILLARSEDALRITRALKEHEFADGTSPTQIDNVTGPYDAIALVEACDLDRLGKHILELRAIDGVIRVTTNLCVRLA